MELEFWYCPEDNTYEPISSKVIDKPSIKQKPSKDEDCPKIILESNKFTLNGLAAELLKVNYEDRLTIQYIPIDGKTTPTIAKDEVLGVTGGNKVSKSNTVACRGKAHDKLEEFGNVFTLVEKSEGIFIMQGDKEPSKYKVVDKNVKVTEPDEITDLEADLDGDSIEIDFSDIL